MTVFRKKLLTIGNDAAGHYSGTDLSDIDLTASSLDKRIKYQCASNHAYCAADGTIQYANPDVWPMEYRDGVAVGRYEPEPQATNLLKWSAQLNRWQNMHTSTSVDGDDYVITATGSATSWARIQQNVTLAVGKYCFTAVVKSGTVNFLVGVVEITGLSEMGRFFANLDTLETLVKTGAGTISGACTAEKYGGYTVVKYVVNVPTAGIYNLYFGPSNALGAGSSGQGDSIISRFAQIETGEHATSPIITESTPATRAAAFALIPNPGSIATSIRVSYSDGTTVDIDFPADGSDIQLAQSVGGWGSRYISRIQYARTL